MIENERRFLLSRVPDLSAFIPEVIMQGYLLNRDGYVVRVRRVSTPTLDGAEYGSLAIKGPRDARGSRQEEELIFDDPALAGQILKRCDFKLLKRRFSLPSTWVVDIFDWHNEGLAIAELEGGEDIYSDTLPEWLGQEISAEPVFNNEWLARRPWRTWSAVERIIWGGDSYH